MQAHRITRPWTALAIFLFLFSAIPLMAAAPTATTGTATGITLDSATLNGTVNANGESATVYFEYGTSTSYGSIWPADQDPVTGSTSTAVTATIFELSANTTYHFRVVATNASGTTNGSDMTFTTLDVPPSVVTGTATGIGASSATLNGTVNAHGYSTTVEFEYGTTTSYGTTVTADQSPVTNTFTIPVTNTLSGLSNNTTYHFRIKATSVNGTSYGLDMSFTIGTVGTAPTATTNAASAINTTAATLNGTVNAGGSSTVVYFEYGTTTSYGSVAPAAQSPLTGTTDTAVSANISELLPNTTYHFRVTATNLNGTDNGVDMTFTTLPQAPTATTKAPTGVGTSSGTMNGTVNANGDSSSVSFEYGLTTAYGTTVPAIPSPVTGSIDTSVSSSISGLAIGLTYHYRVVAENTGGTTYGEDLTFTTGVTPPSVTTNSATGVNSNAATLNGIVNANGSSSTVTFQYGLTTSYDRSIDAVPSTVTGSANTAVTISLSSLTPNATYHYRVAAVNPGGVTYGADMTFTTGNGPAVTTNPASSISSIGATLNGTVNANDASTTVSFEYGLTTAYGITVAATQSPVTGSSDTPVSSVLVGLPSSTTYHYRVIGQNANGTTYGVDMTFTTSPPPVGAPIATTTNTSGLGPTVATLNGLVESNNYSTTVSFEYGLTTAYGTTVTADQSPVQSPATSAVSKAITGLTSSVTYHYRVVAQNAYGTSYGADMTFFTATPVITATTEPASNVLITSATLNGTGNAAGNFVSVNFEYGLTTGYGSTVSGTPGLIASNTDTSITASVSGLTSGLTYHYRLRFIDAFPPNNVLATGNDMTFTTLVSPSVVTDAATNVTTTTGTLHGTVNSNGDSTEVTFEYGETTSYGRTTLATPSPATGSVNTSVSANLSSLTPNTTYHFRARGLKGPIATNGGDMTFITQGLPPEATTNAATSVTNTGATLNGIVNANNDSTTVTFEYGTTTSYGTSVPGSPNSVTGSTNTAVNAILSGLTINTTYHYKVVAQNGSGTTEGADMTFFTGSAPPAATTGGTTNIGSNTATLNGTVNPNNASTTVTFEFGETTAYGRTVTADQSPLTGSIAMPVSANIDLLSANTLYHYHVCGDNAAGTNCGSDMTFMTNVAGTPMVTTGNVSNIAATTATCGGNVTNEGSAPVTARGVCWSTSVNPTIGDNFSTDGAGPGAFTSSITGLNAQTTYYVRAYATNAYGTTYGEGQSLFTLPFAPDVTTDAATAVRQSTATLNGTVNANNDSTTITFEYGTDTSYGTILPAIPSPINGSIDTMVSASLTGLTNGTTYHYRVVAENTGGVSYGNDREFMTIEGVPTLSDAALIILGVMLMSMGLMFTRNLKKG